MEISLVQKFPVPRGSFDTAGEASSNIKRTLKKLGITHEVVRDVAIAAYEAELNLVIHSLGGELVLEVRPEEILLVSQDCGPGIPDIPLALSEGYSTASDQIRSMGFGAGMGLPNIKRHCHNFSIESSSEKGTTIRARYYLNNQKS